MFDNNCCAIVGILSFFVIAQANSFGLLFVPSAPTALKTRTSTTRKDVVFGSTLRRSLYPTTVIRKAISIDGWDDFNGDSYNPFRRNRHSDQNLDDDSDSDSDSNSDHDWWHSELTLLNAPPNPDPSLTAETVALAVCRSLQWADYPTANAGLERCFNFFMIDLREAVTARRGCSTVEQFVSNSKFAPSLQPFMGAKRITLGPPRVTPAKPPFRGALTAYVVTIDCASLMAMQHMSGFDKHGVSLTPPKVNILMILEQQRRPPLQDCWMVRELLNVRHVFAGDTGTVVGD